MAFEFLKKLFGGGNAGGSGSGGGVAATPDAGAAGSKASPEAFVNYIAKSLVDQPELVKVSTVERGNVSQIQIACDKRDIGKLIGKSGKTIASIRLLVASSCGRSGNRIMVEVLE